jgi:hypothetical protein
VTSAGTQVMTAASPAWQIATGSANHTYQLPGDCGAGHPVFITNASTGVLTANSASGATILGLASGNTAEFTSTIALPTATGHWINLPYATVTGVQALDNKRINPRVTSTTSAATLSPNWSNADEYVYTALAANLTISAPWERITGRECGSGSRTTGRAAP